MEEEVDLRDYLNVIKKRWKIILGVFLSSIVISVIVSFSLPKVYEVKLMLRIGKVKDEFLETGNTVIKVFESRSVLSDVVKRLNLPVTEEEIERISGKIYISESVGTLEIKGRGKTPQEAMNLVNAVADVILERHQQFFNKGQEILEGYILRIEKQLVKIEEDIVKLRKKIKQNELTTSEAKAYIVHGYLDSLQRSLDRYNISKVELSEKQMEESYSTMPTCIIVPPMMSNIPILPRKKINVLIAAFVGLIVGLGLAGFLEYFEQSENKN